MRNRGIGRGRMFMGGLLLFAATIAWGTALMMSPHGEVVAEGTEYVRTPVVTLLRNASLWTLVLCGVSAWLLFPTRRPKWPARDYAIIALLVLLAGSSLYTLVWLQLAVLR